MWGPKNGLCKFTIIINIKNIIIGIVNNIINITLGSNVPARPKAFGFSFVDRPNTLGS